ncbi:hypothetical protein [Dickeya zeae]|nr:hypothetical protein [Dickeya zeae]MCO7260520.1 hypothetical protein [Dickeya zeae]
MNFNRYLCQEFIETELGCTDPAQLHLFKEQIVSFTLVQDKVPSLSNAITSDACDVFFKSALSFLEALFSLKRGHSSWAIVKLYYSIFYSLRTYLLLGGYAPIKNGKGEIYFIKCEDGSSPIRISTGSIKGDHKTTIRAFTKFYPSHKLNTNTIDSINIFEWAMQCRELVNYRNSSFIEPEYGYDAIPKTLSNAAHINHLIKQYLNDEYYTYCFVREHSLLSTASVLIFEAIHKFRSVHVPFLTQERQSVFKQLIKKSGLNNADILIDLFYSDADVTSTEN